MNRALALIAVVGLCAGQAFAETSIGQLQLAAAVEKMPAVAAPKPTSPEIGQTVACSMDVVYTEKVTQIIIIRLWKTLDGSAVLRCEGRQPINLKLTASGPSLGLGIPNDSPFRSIGKGISGTVTLRLPFVFVPKQLEGDYVNIGGEILGAGVALSPWVNTDASLNMTIYLPKSFNASAAINLSALKLRVL